MSTFGLIIPGRLVDTNFQLVDQNKFLITIPNAETINHVVVFLTGLVQLPPDMAACIFFSLPDPDAAPTWNYLGYLSNNKPSAIYKLTNLINLHQKRQETGLTINNGALPSSSPAFNYAQAPVIHVAQIGISVESLNQVQQMVPAIDTLASRASSFNQFITKTVTNLYNYCSSFGRSLHELSNQTTSSMDNTTRTNSSQTQFIPMHTLQDWYENYTRRLNNDQNFWKSLA